KLLRATIMQGVLRTEECRHQDRRQRISVEYCELARQPEDQRQIRTVYRFPIPHQETNPICRLKNGLLSSTNHNKHRTVLSIPINRQPQARQLPSEIERKHTSCQN